MSQSREPQSIREWAWRQYDRWARTEPGTTACKAAWKIHLAAFYVKEADMVVKERPATKPVSGNKTRVRIVAASDMDTPTFALHFSKRHKGSLAGQAELPADVTHEVEQMYRAFHSRLHATRVNYKHYHDPDAPHVAVDRALRCLIENHNWGWKELAGLEGQVAVFPDGQIATRINGRKEYHNNVEDATDRMLDANSL